MRVKVLTSSALVDQEKGRWAGLADEVDVTRERGEYLVSVGAAKSLEDDVPDPGPAAENEAPQGDGGKAAGTSTTETRPQTGEKRPQNTRRPLPRTK